MIRIEALEASEYVARSGAVDAITGIYVSRSPNAGDQLDEVKATAVNLALEGHLKGDVAQEIVDLANQAMEGLKTLRSV